MSKISIIIPVFRAEKFINRCLDSLIAQTFTDFEVILVNDGSPDRSGEICEKYAARDKRFVVLHQENTGQATAKNHALNWFYQNSDSEWLSFIDSDDWVHPQYLEGMWKAKEEFGTDIAACRFVELSSRYVEFPQIETFKPVLQSAEDVYTNNGSIIEGYMVAKIYRRELLENIRFPDGKVWEDLATLYKVLLPVERIATVSDKMYYYYMNPDSTVHMGWSPKRVYELEAYEEQLEFFKHKSKYKKIYELVQSNYVWTMQKQYAVIMKDDKMAESEKAGLQKNIRDKLRKAIIKYHSNKLISIKNYSWAYEIAFPTYMKFYWIFRAQLKKLGLAKD